MNHRQTTIRLKKTQVDAGMVRMLRWLNGKQGVYTEWSCEGGQDGDGQFLPYVSFICTNPESLNSLKASILAFTCTDGREIQLTQTTSFSSNSIDTKYGLVFSSKEQFNNFQKRVCL